jgi:DegV family protein with EDD domain
MNKIKIITDSTADLRVETYKKYDISVVPLIVNIGEESFKDGVEIDLKGLYERVEKDKVLPKTSAASPGAFFELFEKFSKQGYEILYLGIGSTLSLTFQAANLAKADLPCAKIRIVDSLSLSTGSGSLVIRAAELREKGLGLEEIAKELERIVPKNRGYFAVESLEYLHRGGRVSGGKYFLGTLLRAHPIIKVVDGVLSVFKTPKGKMIKALDDMLNELRSLGMDKIDLGQVMVTHAFADESVIYMKNELIKMGFPESSIYVSLCGTVIGTHCGPNTIGVLFIEK